MSGKPPTHNRNHRSSKLAVIRKHGCTWSSWHRKGITGRKEISVQTTTNRPGRRGGPWGHCPPPPNFGTLFFYSCSPYSYAPSNAFLPFLNPQNPHICSFSWLPRGFSVLCQPIYVFCYRSLCLIEITANFE